MALMNDLTVIYLTANLLPENWSNYQRKVLLEAVGDSPIISVSRKPINLGANLLDVEIKSTLNIYRQMLRAIKLAKTPFIAIAEDDVLYPESHFNSFRPGPNTFAYNMNRLNIYQWNRIPKYSWKNRVSNCTLIAPTELALNSLEERLSLKVINRFEKRNGELGREQIDKYLHTTIRKICQFFSDISVVRIDHQYGSDVTALHRSKAPGSIQAYDIPFWGRAEDIVSKFV
jgi:hypothetical protein